MQKIPTLRRVAQIHYGYGDIGNLLIPIHGFVQEGVHQSGYKENNDHARIVEMNKCFTVLQKTENGLKLVQNVHIRQGAGCHQVMLWNDVILVPCLFLDRVMLFDRELNRTGSIDFNAGTGPRHGVFSKDGKTLYLVSELSNELFVIESGTWKILSSISVLENNEKNQRDTAAVRLSEDERFLYVSTRTKDIISVIDLTGETPRLIQTVSCGGRHPRDFILLDGYLLSANRFSNTVVSFEINEDGTVGKQVSSIHVPEAVSLIAK